MGQDVTGAISLGQEVGNPSMVIGHWSIIIVTGQRLVVQVDSQ